MKHLWLVGESLPLREDGTPRLARKSANLPDRLVPLDPRHGVFPNLVMKPLFAAGYSLSLTDGDRLLDFFQELSSVVADHSERRFNFFNDRATRPKKRAPNQSPEPDEPSQHEVFTIDQQVISNRIGRFEEEHDLWLIFGHQTNFGLLWWLLDSEMGETVERDDIRDFSKNFVMNLEGVPEKNACGEDSQLSSRVGLLHRLCTGDGMEGVLSQAVMNPRYRLRLPPERTVKLLRSIVPLMHNEGYQDGSNPTGNAQDHFVRRATGESSDGDLYWQVMGNAIANRILGRFVK